MASGRGQRTSFFPKADAAVLSSRHGTPPLHPQTVGPIYDPSNVNRPVEPWSPDLEKSFYPPPAEEYAPAMVPNKPKCFSDRYLRATLAKNERLRLSMLWYYTRDILTNAEEFLSGLQEKTYLAQESTQWEFVVIGILDVNFYIRLATIGLPLGILPRGETICAHTVNQPPGSVFLLPNMMEDWRFQQSPYFESGKLRAYAGAPLRLQNESGECVGLGSLCVASSTSQDPLTKTQQYTLARLADWVVSDIVQFARARRQRERRRMSDLISTVQRETRDVGPEEPVLRILRATYPNAIISLQSSEAAHIEIEGREPILSSDLEDGLWEDINYIDDFITGSNQQDLPSTRVVRIIASQCDSISGPSLIVVASKDFRLIFDDVDSWFVQTCASMISETWHKRLLGEVMRAKEKFLRGFSHHLRTPIHGILGSVELLAEILKSQNLHKSDKSISSSLEDISQANSSEVSPYLDTIRTAGQDLISIVNSMITLNRWADIAVKDREYAMHTIYELETELSNEMLKIFSGDTRYRASIFWNHDLPPGYDSFRFDLTLLRDCLLPLVINAVQNTSEGIVSVTVSVRPDDKALIVDVEDTGRGIHPDHQQRIFEPYEKVDMQSTGAGLGLTLASKFATLLHGSVSLISSEVGRGSHFRATLCDVKNIDSSFSLQRRVAQLKNLPSKFYNLAYNLNKASLCDYFIRFLDCHGFTPSNSMENCFIILDFVPDLEQRRVYLSQVPSEQVAICLLPASEAEANFEQISNNIVYVRGPFLSSTMSSALEQADELVLKIKAFQADMLRPVVILDRRPKTDDGLDTDDGISTDDSLGTDESLSTDEEAKPMDDLLHSKECVTEVIANGPDDPISGDTVSHIYLPDLAVPIKSNTLIPILSSLFISRPTVLLVDDNTINLRIMQMYCSRRGLPYYSATDGQQAVKMFSQHQSLSATGKGSAIQLILMDLQMPLCDGIEATRQIRSLEKQKQWTESIVFIVTGQDSPTDRLAAESAGANEFFVKPVGIKLLDHGVKRHFPAFEAS